MSHPTGLSSCVGALKRASLGPLPTPRDVFLHRLGCTHRQLGMVLIFEGCLERFAYFCTSPVLLRGFQKTLSLISLLLFHVVYSWRRPVSSAEPLVAPPASFWGPPGPWWQSSWRPPAQCLRPVLRGTGWGTGHSLNLQSYAGFLRMSLTKSLLSASRGDWFLGILDTYCGHFVASCQSIAFSGSLECNSRCGACRQLIEKVFLLVWAFSKGLHWRPCQPLGTSLCILSGALIDNWAWF